MTIKRRTGNSLTTGLTTPPGPSRLSAAGVAVGALITAHARADVAASDQPALPSVEVTGTALSSGHDVPQSDLMIDNKELAEQHAVLMQDALRNVPGVTLNSGEGGAHGDSINLRGLSVPDSFFLDGVRDIGQYQRDTFDSDSIAVLLGPSSVLFGRGSTAGVINTVSKQPLLTPLADISVSAGQADLFRTTADLNLPISDTIAARLALMDQRSGVVERDQVLYRRYGIAPTLAFGIGTPTRLTLSYFRQDENNIPDYGIPFVDGAPAGVDRSNYYGLVDYDRTRTNVNIGSARFEHEFSDDISLSDTLRYANYGFEYLLSGTFLGNDFVPPPPPGTPYGDINVSRDQPSSAGTTSELINRSDLTARFAAGGLAHTLTTGLELSREQSNVSRFENGLDDIAPTPLLAPDPFHTAPTPLVAVVNPRGRGDDVSVYAIDSIAMGPHWDVDAGLRWDRFESKFSEQTGTDTAFSRTDTLMSPRAAVIFKPDNDQSYYLSYGTAYNPVIEYLILAPSSNSLSPEKNSTLELGVKLSVLSGKATLTGALYDSRLTNARLSDPDDPTVQEMPFDQHVKGVEFGMSGYITDRWELTANYTHMDDRITKTSDPLALGKFAPNTPHDAFNFWNTVDVTSAWIVGGGFNVMSDRHADTDNTAHVPGYVVLNAMTTYNVNEHFKLQLNLNNVANKLYFTGFYYTGIDENHALPSAGRTLIGIANYRF